MAELKAKRDREEEERVKAMTPKEREDYKKKRDRPTGESASRNVLPTLLGRRPNLRVFSGSFGLLWLITSGKKLFETTKSLATSDEALYEEGGVAVDMSQYSREEREAERRREEEEEEKRRQGLLNDGNISD